MCEAVATLSPSSPPSRAQPTGFRNKNVRLVLVYAVLLSIYSSLISNTPLAAYINLISNDNNTYVGVATGIQGIVNLIVALPVGALADRIGREKLLRVAAALALIAAGYMAVCLLYIHDSGKFDDDVTYYSLCGASALWGLFMGLHGSPLEALFADSVATGDRSRIYVLRSSLRTLGNAVGPLVSIFCFLPPHNHWEIHELTVILLVGIGFSVPPSICLFLFKEDYTLGDASEGISSRRVPPSLRASGRSRSDAPRPDLAPLQWVQPPAATFSPSIQSPQQLANEGSPEASSSDLQQTPEQPIDKPWVDTEPSRNTLLDDSSDKDEERSSFSMCSCTLTVRHIAPLVAMSDTFAFLGNGMTVKFFSIFFWRRLHLNPVTVNSIMLCGPIGVALCALLMQRLSLYLGRVIVSIICKGLGMSMLIAIALIQESAPWAPYAIVPMYLLRTWLINCTSGLTKSVLNDYVPKRHRAKWNALESVNLFSWSGSAFLGGILIDKINYQNTFLITAGLQFCSLACLVPLIPLVAAESRAQRHRRGKVATSDANVCPQPLLASAHGAPSCSSR